MAGIWLVQSFFPYFFIQQLNPHFGQNRGKFTDAGKELPVPADRSGRFKPVWKIFHTSSSA